MTQATRPTTIDCARPGCNKEKPVGKSGPIPTYCSLACRAKLSAERAKQDGRYEAELERLRRRNAERSEAQCGLCPYCGDLMTNPRRIQCGAPKCKLRFNADRQAKRSRAILEATGEWPHRQYAEQQREYHDRKRAELGHWRKQYPEAAAASDARRRMREQQSRTGEAFAPIDVHTRDGWRCGLCGSPVDPELAWPHPLSASVDHVVPLSRGGEHSMANVQSAHLGCNSRKGHRLPGQGKPRVDQG
ncbi:HNH endonuclease [Streptomyces decoyicus]|uniref:HNH endonuclease n=1 Tax=Streptomyces decoyicus TaxID=249567 RepID=UPI0033A0A91F